MTKILIIVGILIGGNLPAFYVSEKIQGLILELEKPLFLSEVNEEEERYPFHEVGTPPPPANTQKFTGVNLEVPFSSQAPYGDWSMPYQEACEEVSALLVDLFYKKKPAVPELVRQEILNMVEWQLKTFGHYEHTTAKETAQLLQEYFGYKRVDVEFDISMEDIKAHLMAGRPLIVPLAGRMVDNPFYQAPGPIYHMLVVKGMTKDGNFITNDVGTKHGHDYVYNAKIFYDAIHDAPIGGGLLNNMELEKYIPNGRKVIIVVYPN